MEPGISWSLTKRPPKQQEHVHSVRTVYILCIILNGNSMMRAAIFRRHEKVIGIPRGA